MSSYSENETAPEAALIGDYIAVMGVNTHITAIQDMIRTRHTFYVWYLQLTPNLPLLGHTHIQQIRCEGN